MLESQGRLYEASTWGEAEQKLLEIEQEYINAPNVVWFRGQSNSCWSLKSTLERKTDKVSVLNYHHLITRIKPEIESFTKRIWQIPSTKEITEKLKDEDSFWFGVDFLPINYMAHLRHYGFPSPLLDWTYSPYIAAFFAFTGAESNKVAIYVYISEPDGTKASNSAVPSIFTVGGLINPHPRHFRQQSTYSICALQYNNDWAFTPHQSVFESERSRRFNQDVLWKVTIPASEKIEVLKKLNRFNLNAFSLFDNEESLMQMLAFKSFAELGIA